MSKFVVFSILVCLSLAACSTTRVEIPVYVRPSEALLTPCSPPRIREAEYVRDLVNNSNARQSAWEKCNARHEALLKWHEELRTSEGTTTAGGKRAKRSSP